MFKKNHNFRVTVNIAGGEDTSSYDLICFLRCSRTPLCGMSGGGTTLLTTQVDFVTLTLSLALK